MSKESIVKGTFILTLAGLLTRVMGFFYKIYLSNIMSAEQLGLYQLIFPVYGLMYTLYGAGIQTAISQLVANKKEKKAAILLKGCCLSLSIALPLSFLLYTKSSYIAAHLLMEKNCQSSLRVLSMVFPFCGITACIHGYYYGLKKTKVPALSQLIEQMIRILSVYLLATYFRSHQAEITGEIAILGIVLGEIAANIVCLSFVSKVLLSKQKKSTYVLRSLLKLSIPLTGTKLVISLLHSFEAVLIPFMLKIYGFNAKEALSIYGILTGMTLPFLLFPSAITNSLSLLILPAISEADAANNQQKIKKTAELSIQFSLLLGLYATCVFFLFGNSFGLIFFHNKTAGLYMVTLSWLCPFLYLSTTLGSILNGLNKAYLTFRNTIISLSIRIFFLCFFVPKKGLYGYLLGLLAAQILLCVLDYASLWHQIRLSFAVGIFLIKPTLILIGCGLFMKQLYPIVITLPLLHKGIWLLTLCSMLLIGYTLLLSLFHIIPLPKGHSFRFH